MELSTERLACNESHWPTVVQSRLNRGAFRSSRPSLLRRYADGAVMFQHQLACRLSSLRRLLVSVLDDGEDA